MATVVINIQNLATITLVPQRHCDKGIVWHNVTVTQAYTLALWRINTNRRRSHSLYQLSYPPIIWWPRQECVELFLHSLVSLHGVVSRFLPVP